MRRLARITTVVAATFALAGSAYGYWSASGAGASTVTTGSSIAALQLAPASVSQRLLPTGTATGEVSATVTNPNAFAVHVAQLSLDATNGTAGFSANAAVCALSFAAQDNGGAGWSFAPGNTSLSLASSITMGTGAASACQGRTFTLYLVAS
jgi:hypothetical protein